MGELDLLGQGVLVQVLSTLTTANEKAAEELLQTSVDESRSDALKQQAAFLTERLAHLRAQAAKSKNALTQIRELTRRARADEWRQFENLRARNARAADANRHRIALLRAEHARKQRLSRDLDAELEAVTAEESELRATHLRLIGECAIARSCLADEEFARADAELKRAAARANFFEFLRPPRDGADGAGAAPRGAPV
jgi:hypothetical protein